MLKNLAFNITLNKKNAHLVLLKYRAGIAESSYPFCEILVKKEPLCAIFRTVTQFGCYALGYELLLSTLKTIVGSDGVERHKK